MKWWWMTVPFVAVVIGVIIGMQINVRPKSDPESKVTAFREVILGTPAQAPTAEKPWQPSSRLTQKRRYATTDLLALRVVSDEPAEKHISLTARLLKEDGSVQTLSPSQIIVAGGTGGYCCWTVATPGVYQLQLFSGGQAPFVLPLTIVKAPPQGSKPLQLL